MLFHHDTSNDNLRHGYLVQGNYEEIQTNMLDGGMTLAGLYGQVRNPLSFTAYMRDFLPLKPDVMLFTMHSAIPLADSVRGYYEELGQESPQLAYIRANRYLSDPTTTVQNGYVQRTIDAETTRMRQKFDGTTSVIFDQFIASGMTIRLAETILQRAGVGVLAKTDAAQWYEHTYPSDVNRRHMTSAHAPFMKEVGRLAAQTVMPTSPHDYQ